MKTVLLYANEDPGMESRLQAALDVARVFESHIGCVQVTPFDSFIMSDPFGGAYALPGIVEVVDKTDAAHRARIEDRLRGEGVSWDWQRYDGAPAQIITDRSRLSDLIILSLPGESAGRKGELSIAGDVVIHARPPVLAIPQASRSIDCLGPAMVAWNGAVEAAHALRLTLSMLRKASNVHIVTVTDDKTGFPAIDASQYLSRHGIGSELLEWPRDGRGTADALLDAVRALGVACVVMGAYGHSRLSETVLGGATRDMLVQAAVPLLFAH